MGFFKTSIKVIKEVATLGGAGRLEEAKQAYEQVYKVTYLPRYQACTSTAQQIEKNLTEIGEAFNSAMASLLQAKDILTDLADAAPDLKLSSASRFSVHKINALHTQFSTSLRIGGGMAAGGAMAAGSWALVGVLGSASTGAAISGLSGVAATNATLAWFGGGALAAGGAGMSGGLAVLGGITVLPVIAFAAYGAHKKANEVIEATAQLEAEAQQLNSKLHELREKLRLVLQIKPEVLQVCGALIDAQTKCQAILYPWGWLSRLKQWAWGMLGQTYITPEIQAAIEHLAKCCADFITKFQHQEPLRIA